MLIGLLSDTHVRISGHNVSLSTLTSSELPLQIREAFRGVDLILHAGDVYSLPILDQLETIAPVLATEGDDDPFETTIDRRVKHTQTITVEGVTIWMSHYGEWEDARKKPPDIIVYGHTHRSKLEDHNGTIRINPGSPTFPRYDYILGTVGFISIKSGKAETRIMQLEGEIGGFPNYAK
ncbi:MAG TPA: metallophosphoesterase family protein [Dehalococcoidia bacterium]|nr:metallophosphoesterase family protein [Dehalococcoidia bacterium]